MAAARGFAYRGRHGAALGTAGDWFEPGPWPNHVAWWVGETERPTWRQGVEKLETLAAEGPSPQAFTLRRAFAADGAA